MGLACNKIKKKNQLYSHFSPPEFATQFNSSTPTPSTMPLKDATQKHTHLYVQQKIELGESLKDESNAVEICIVL